MRQQMVREAYQNNYVQWVIAALIMGNFLTNVVEKQVDPWNIYYKADWKVIEAFWNIIFIFELAWNMYGTWYISTLKGHFLCSSWNLFDVLVVGVSLPSLAAVDLPGPLSQLRMLRAFRVFRLFKRIKSRIKLSSLSDALPGIINAAIVQLIVMCIYAILAVDLFGEFGTNGTYVNINGDEVPQVSMRGARAHTATAACSLCHCKYDVSTHTYHTHTHTSLPPFLLYQA